MKLVNCILLASLALGASFAQAGETAASCTAGINRPLNVNEQAHISVLDNQGNDVTSRVEITGAAAGR